MENNSRKRRRLSAEEKWSIYQECEQSGVKIGEVLRKHGLYSSDLQLIRREVKEAALERLSRSRPGRKKAAVVPVEERDQLKRELEEKEKALAELSVMFTTLKKKCTWNRGPVSKRPTATGDPTGSPADHRYGKRVRDCPAHHLQLAADQYPQG
ncbi:helix-turn-helix domain-containing protein [Chlorobium phaeovibrioides]|uniref:Transposase n=1 Tax=Chlorobium phaeovibrioides TaxID=1094 RepID=A0A5C2QH11_CHLPH|nr:hypothetical protein [Chlorobium phaeovibrioides]KAA6230592.1 hypothetical protein FP507_10030 [Chlorobium phaeovibrioides]QEQ56843.1 hypothetical protein FNV82_03880 [Chlorobium phaeovibrioides]QEQ56864.1 hypothetical protein FNV82_04010 [Chlorobium phaeovibrioides]QEQ57189.1 hypothetical protein FNV82_06100 [Chlorobium phaeovibrioides]QEQ57229.1 hypothetical protein FNV82_06355 [Chlorobium phaeovibrioides]